MYHSDPNQDFIRTNNNNTWPLAAYTCETWATTKTDEQNLMILNEDSTTDIWF